MKPQTRPLAIVIAALVAAASGYRSNAVAEESPPDVIEIMKKNFMAQKVKDSTQKMTMTLIDARGIKRERKVESYSKLLENQIDQARVARFLSPPDVIGTATLTKENSGGDDDIWIYLPALKKIRRLVASNKKDSFMGSDFSYGDVITPRVEDWKHTLLRIEKCGANDCYVVESVPVSKDVERNAGSNKRVQWIRTDAFMSVKGEYTDLAGRPFKEFHAEDIWEVDKTLHRWMPKKITMKNVQTGGITEITFDDVKVNTGVKDEVFTERYLTR
ncbi:MAG: outer membrane lipoprotein-sorting protein [Deltaproteobacteria bacterium]|nr:outer membrane lipoprotein-sorting protein [Deltaproteobacteria bacterium]